MSEEGTATGRLDSWKEIASYLKRDVSTVQRWEKREGMPVRRHLHGKLGSVYAFQSELDEWWQCRTSGQPPGQPFDSTGDDATIASRPHYQGLTLAAAGCAALVIVVLALWALRRSNEVWRNPLADARFGALTEFGASEFAAAISRDGRFVAYLSDRDGGVDVWVTRVGTGESHNLTRGAFPELVNPSVRTMQFSPQGDAVSFWVRRRGATKPDDISIWSAPTWAQAPQPLLDGVAELDWSNAGTRLVYHTPGPGDPTFVRTLADRVDHPIFTAAAGLHAHFPTWSPDDTFIYFVQGTVPDGMDVWRIKSAGGAPERLTFHNARVSHPVFLDGSTLAYLATAPDGSGPWIYGLDLASRDTHRLSAGIGRYTSLSATSDGRRLVATVARPRGSLWRMPLSDRIDVSAAQRIPVPAANAVSPRLGPGYLLFVSSRDGGETISKLAEERTTELWSAPGARIVGPPAISADGRRIAFAAEQRQRAQLYVMEADGSAVRTISDVHEPRGAPSWSPDGRFLAVAQLVDGAPRVVRVGVDDGTVGPLVAEYSIDPAWSSDGKFIVYSGPDVGTTFQIKSAAIDGGTHSGAVNMTLTRGGRRVAFLPGARALLVLKGEIEHKDVWQRDLATGLERQITAFGSNVRVQDFDVSADGNTLVFDQIQESSEIVLIDIPSGR